MSPLTLEERKALAQGFRGLARGAEQIEQACRQNNVAPEDCAYYSPDGAEQAPFTCNAVKNALGQEARAAYFAAFFGFGTEENETHLWHEEGDVPSIRVIMLCFAAAMAETGDL